MSKRKMDFFFLFPAYLSPQILYLFIFGCTGLLLCVAFQFLQGAYSLVAMGGLLLAVASLVPWSTGSGAHGLRSCKCMVICSMTCGIFLQDRTWRPLHWQADSYTLSHRKFHPKPLLRTFCILQVPCSAFHILFHLILSATASGGYFICTFCVHECSQGQKCLQDQGHTAECAAGFECLSDSSLFFLIPMPLFLTRLFELDRVMQHACHFTIYTTFPQNSIKLWLLQIQANLNFIWNFPRSHPLFGKSQCQWPQTAPIVFMALCLEVAELTNIGSGNYSCRLAFGG